MLEPENVVQLEQFLSAPNLIIHSRQPFNAEPPLPRLIARQVTPQQGFYVRTHGDIPKLHAARHRLHVGAHVATSLDLSMHELRAYFRSAA